MASPATEPHPFPFRTSAMARSTATGTVKPQYRNKVSSFLAYGITVIGVAMAALLLLWSLWSFLDPKSSPGSNDDFSTSVIDIKTRSSSTAKEDCSGVNLRDDPETRTFYDDPTLRYSVDGGVPMKNWDKKRKEWLKHHPSFEAGLQDRILMITGSQPSPCRNPIGDHLLMRTFKNKVDYCRIHGHNIFFNTALLHPDMKAFWAKIPIVRAAMFAHPEVEWIWWMDVDAVFTDMEFKLPLEKYREHNFVIHGWPNAIWGEVPSSNSLNAGVFLIRNCQWSIDLMEEWAAMGPLTPASEEWGRRQQAFFKDKVFPDSDDQSALLYLMLKGNKRWTERIFVETDFYFEGYWVQIVPTLQRIQERYTEMEREVPVLRRRHAELVSEHYAEAREPYLKQEQERESERQRERKRAGNGNGNGNGGEDEDGWKRRPFVTHFVGCQPCSGTNNKMYPAESCWQGMETALNFADNQVLRSFGFAHPDLLNSSLSPLPFDYPAAAAA